MEQIVGHSILDKYFDETTMSLHLKANRATLKKKGGPGNRQPVVGDVISKQELLQLIDAIFAEVEARDDGFLEIDRSLSKVLQLGPYRIVIVHPPLSDGLEMTVVKPIKKLVLSDYNLDESIVELLRNKSKGILISGSPGSGKTTFAQALIDLYHKDNRIIKTIESPRDLLLDDDIVQYSFTYASHEELKDILLLSRPDFTIYDEVRNVKDFELYKDLRLTGIGLVGVIHATRPVDSIQRFLGTIEMGIIPQVVDTVLYINKGMIEEIYQLELTVKMPQGMQSEDLARPVILVSSFLTKKVEFEIYSYGEQIVVMPLKDGDTQASKNKAHPLSQYAKQAIHQKLRQIIPCHFLVSVKGSDSLQLYIPIHEKGRIIGKGGATITELEKTLGMRVNVKTFEDLPLLDVPYDIQYGKKNQSAFLYFPKEYANKTLCFLVDDDALYFTADANGAIMIKKKNILTAIHNKSISIVDYDHL